jgi:uncharacterized membrane protein YebE (DUF533 family)
MVSEWLGIPAAFEDGHISKRQRRVLSSMIESMGIDTKVAEALENNARAALTSETRGFSAYVPAE